MCACVGQSFLSDIFITLYPFFSDRPSHWTCSPIWKEYAANKSQEPSCLYLPTLELQEQMTMFHLFKMNVMVWTHTCAASTLLTRPAWNCWFFTLFIFLEGQLLLGIEPKASRWTYTLNVLWLLIDWPKQPISTFHWLRGHRKPPALFGGMGGSCCQGLDRVLQNASKASSWKQAGETQIPGQLGLSSKKSRFLSSKCVTNTQVLQLCNFHLVQSAEHGDGIL